MLPLIISPARHEDIVDIQRIYMCLRRPVRHQLQVEEYFIVRDEGSVVGCAAVHLAGSVKEREGYLYGLGVQKEFQRQGIGRALTLARVERVRTFGGRRAVALAMFWNVNFFRRLGFVTTRRDELSPEMSKLPDFCDIRYRRSAVMSKKVAA